MSSVKNHQKILVQEKVFWSSEMGEAWQRDFSLVRERASVRYIFIFSEKVPAELNVTVRLQARGTSAEVLAAYLGTKNMRSIVNFTISHEAPDTYGRVLFRAMLRDVSRIDFNGMLYIAKGADGSDSYLSAKALMLSDKSIARIDPKLEILANSIKASHGATVGRVSEQDMFYLQSRGLDRNKAEQILLQGFFAEAFAMMPEGVSKEVRLLL